MNIKNKKAFTFIETMVVVAVLSVIAMVIGGVVNNGLSLWSRVKDIAVEEDPAIFFDKMTLDLENTIRFTGITFSGSATSVHIPSYARTKDGRMLPGLIVYSFDEKDGIINRSGTDYINFMQQKEPDPTPLISEVSSAVFSYYAYNANTGMYEWSEEWLEEDMPQAVRIELTLKENEDAVNYRHTVNIPVGKLEFFKD